MTSGPGVFRKVATLNSGLHFAVMKGKDMKSLRLMAGASMPGMQVKAMGDVPRLPTTTDAVNVSGSLQPVSTRLWSYSRLHSLLSASQVLFERCLPITLAHPCKVRHQVVDDTWLIPGSQTHIAATAAIYIYGLFSGDKPGFQIHRGCRACWLVLHRFLKGRAHILLHICARQKQGAPAKKRTTPSPLARLIHLQVCNGALRLVIT